MFSNISLQIVAQCDACIFIYISLLYFFIEFTKFISKQWVKTYTSRVWRRIFVSQKLRLNNICLNNLPLGQRFLLLNICRKQPFLYFQVHRFVKFLLEPFKLISLIFKTTYRNLQFSWYKNRSIFVTHEICPLSQISSDQF